MSRAICEQLGLFTALLCMVVCVGVGGWVWSVWMCVCQLNYDDLYWVDLVGCIHSTYIFVFWFLCVCELKCDDLFWV